MSEIDLYILKKCKSFFLSHKKSVSLHCETERDNATL